MKKEKIKLFDFLPILSFNGINPTKAQIKKFILTISDIFTFYQSERPIQYMKEDELLKGYLLYFVPVNLAKISSVLRELFLHPVFLKKKELKILDIGCGPSPALVSLFNLIEEQKITLEYLRYIGIESEKKAIKFGEKIIETLKPDDVSVKYEFIEADASDLKTYLSLKQIKPDIMLFSNSLGEIFEMEKIKLEDFINIIKPFTYKNPDFTLIIIEPGTKKASIRLHKIKDTLIKELSFYPYSPCLNELPCSALKANNWCYEERKWTPPHYLSFLSSVGLQVNYLKFSYIVMRKDGANIRDTFDEEGDIIKNTSHLLNEKGKSRLWACWKGNLIDMEKLKRDFIDNEPWLKIRKGDYFSIDKYINLSEKKFRIPKDCKIKILYST